MSAWQGRRRWAAVAALSLVPLAGCSGAGEEREQTAAECPAVTSPAAERAGQMRGAWISTVQNIDWPSRAGLPAGRQRAEYRAQLDRARSLGLNAVFVQVRPTADAFYPGAREPWSEWLTGKQGRDPGYDPLKFLVEEAHARNMQFHAWFNPYRVAKNPSRKRLAENSPARRNPGWVRTYGKALWYDPGLPEVRDLAVNAVLDVVRKYDVDGVHFDDYFYPYPIAGKDFPDGSSYKRYGAGKSRAAWRRANVNALVSRLSAEIRKAKPHVSFGISPFGVWRNKSTDPAGSATKALQSYDEIYADARTWIKQGWLDYIAPQLYWHLGFRAADYRVLVDWWSRQVAGTKTHLYIGQAAYRVGNEKDWKNPAELGRHLALNAKYAPVRGDIFFSMKSLRVNKRGFADRLRREHYSAPAMVPVLSRLARNSADKARLSPSGLRAETGREGVRLRWEGPDVSAEGDARSYAVYRAAGRRAGCAPVAHREFFALARNGTYTDRSAKAGATYTYYVTALDRSARQSRPGRGATVTHKRG